MKRFRIIYILFVAAGLLSGCERELETEGISKITYFPTLTMNGEQWNSVLVGQPFTDPGVEATENENQIEVIVEGSVDSNVPGVYVLAYTATNKDGFSSSIRRYVGVITPEAEAADISGTYMRDAGAFGVSTVTKLGPGLYQTDNVGGVAVPGPATTVLFFHYEGNKLGVPIQSVNGNMFSATNATVIPGESYTWIVINGGYLDNQRTFIKQ